MNGNAKKDRRPAGRPCAPTLRPKDARSPFPSALGFPLPLYFRARPTGGTAGPTHSS